MKSLFGKWLVKLDAALEIESSLADLHLHNATAGSIREFLVKGLLQRFLPAMVTIETGKVVDAGGGMSNQIDIILFDSRVPCMRSPGGVGLFPVEGVLGTIAVKTGLRSTADVVDALENCNSVVARAATGDADFLDAIDRKIDDVVCRERLTRLDAYIQVMHLALPPTYVFAISNGLTASGLCDAIDNWFQRPREVVEVVPCIPRMIVGGNRVAVAHDGIAKFAVAKAVTDEAFRQHGPTGRVLAGIWPDVQHRWSWLATHILLTVSYRLGIRHDFLQARYAIDRYLPFHEYFESEHQQEAVVEHILWSGQFPRFREKS